MFLTSGEDSPRERKKIERNTRREERKHKEREREANEKRKKSSLSSLSLFLLFCFSLSLSLVFFFWLCFFWLCVLSLEVFLSQACLVSLSPAILMNLREVFRERHFAAQKRALQREKREREREREKETRERERARANTLYRRKFLSFALSLRHYREELTTTRKTEYSFLSENRKLACFPWETIIMRTKRRRKNHRRR
jgi:hypothetical protein